MEIALGCFSLLAFAAALVPLLLALAQRGRIKTLEANVQKLSARLAQLEAGAVPASPAETSSAPAPPPAPVPRPIEPIRTAPVATAPKAVRAPRPARAPIDWEAFMGVKLSAWIGGFALFLGVIFAVKYSFENNLITPAMRVILGALTGLGLAGAGWLTSRRKYRVPGQSLCATGILVLYADIFGAHTFYGLLSLGAAFGLMSIVTVAAFLLAVKMDAPVVVVLGLVGGFLTPPLLTTAEHTLPIFSYVALLNAGIAAVALRKRWDYLFALAALGTIAMEFLWLPIFNADRVATGFPVFLTMQAEFLVFGWLRRRLKPNEQWSIPSAASLGFASFVYAFYLLSISSLATRLGFFFGFTFLADIGLLALALLLVNPARLAAPAGAVCFALLAAWTAGYLEHQRLWWALGAYLLFALIHAGFSVWPPRPAGKEKEAQWQGYIPLLALVLLFICVGRGETSFAVWVVVLLVDLFAVALALTSRSVIALLLALFVTVGTAALWIVTAPPLETSVVGVLTVVGGFGVFFSTAATFLGHRLGFGGGDARRNVPALAAAMPFVLLLMVVAKLPLTDPTLLFAVALLMAIVLLGLGILARTSWIAAVGLAFTWAVEREWHSCHFANTSALVVLGWYVIFGLVFIAYPFFTAEESALPWAVGALSGVLHFSLVYELVSAASPNLRNGLLPAVFIIPYVVGLWFLLVRRDVVPASGDARLAWQGGAALLFLSLIFPIQFEREWITLGWAMEGFALLVLFRFVPNPGLRLAGAGLLSVAFVRLALNPAVLEYHRRTALRLWNWYLYVYGLTSVCLLLGARLAQSSVATLVARILPRLLYTLGALLLFLLLNIEIADYFSIGPTLTFSFSGNFARDMTYSIAWALFAFALLLIGMKKQLRFVRYAGLALLVVTLLKLFLHDLGQLSQLYRIGAFIGVALILIVASFVYQRFLAPKDEVSGS